MPGEVKIVGVSLIDGKFIDGRRTRQVASFDCEFRGLRVSGCLLMCHEKAETPHAYSVWMPSLTGKGERPCIVFFDKDLMAQVRDAATRTYKAVASA